MAEHGRHHRTNPAEGGWDPSIVKAPVAHKSDSKKRHHKHRSRRKRRKALKSLGIALGVVLALALAAGVALALYVRSIDEAMSIGDEREELEAALTDSPTDKPFYALLLGTDVREVISDSDSSQAKTDPVAADELLGGYSDVMIVARVDAVNSKVSMVSVPRDTAWKNGQGETVKINDAYHRGGAAQAVRAVEDTMGIHISHYAEITGIGLENLVDVVGGIVVDVPIEIRGTTLTHDHVDLQPGKQHVNGAEALALANFRKIYDDDQDYNRQIGARQVVTGLIDAIRTRPAWELPGIVSQAASCVRTDMSSSDLVELVQLMGTSVHVMSGSLPYSGGIDRWIDYPNKLQEGAPWLCYVNTSGMERIMQALDAGEDPSTVSYKNDVVHYAEQPESTWPLGLVEPEEYEEMSGGSGS